jgi:hypothetical protein
VSDTRENRPLPEHEFNFKTPCARCGHTYGAHSDWDKGPCIASGVKCQCAFFVKPRATRPQEAAAEVERCMSIKFPCAFCGDVVCPEEGCAAHTNGVELSNGEWVCSGECWEARQVEIWEAFAWWGTDWSTAALTQAEQRGDSAGYERGIRDASQTAQNVASGYAKIKNLDAQVAMRLFAAAILSKLSTPQTTNRE